MKLYAMSPENESGSAGPAPEPTPAPAPAASTPPPLPTGESKVELARAQERLRAAEDRLAEYKGKLASAVKPEDLKAAQEAAEAAKVAAEAAKAAQSAADARARKAIALAHMAQAGHVFASTTYEQLMPEVKIDDKGAIDPKSIEALNEFVKANGPLFKQQKVKTEPTQIGGVLPGGLGSYEDGDAWPERFSDELRSHGAYPSGRERLTKMTASKMHAMNSMLGTKEWPKIMGRR